MEINICFATNDRYAPHAAALIASIMANKLQDDELSFHFFSDKTTPSVQSKFCRMSCKMGFQLTIYEMSDELFADFPVFMGSRTPYFRLSMHRMLPDSLKKILYLDCDMIVTSSLRELYSTDISECYAAVVAEATKVPYFPVPHAYFNSGMILLNLEKYKNENMEDQAIQFGYEHPDWIRAADQEILNYIFKGNVTYLPLKWNMMLDAVHRKELLLMDWIIYPYSETVINEAENNPRIIHYVTPKKPWYSMCKHPNKSSYWKYARKTQFYRQTHCEYYRTMLNMCFSYFKTMMKTMCFLQFRTGRKGYLRIFGISFLGSSPKTSHQGFLKKLNRAVMRPLENLWRLIRGKSLKTDRSIATEPRLPVATEPDHPVETPADRQIRELSELVCQLSKEVVELRNQSCHDSMCNRVA